MAQSSGSGAAASGSSSSLFPLLSLRHLFGCKPDTRHNMHYQDENNVVYVAGHLIVLYNIDKKSQRFITLTQPPLHLPASLLPPQQSSHALPPQPVPQYGGEITAIAITSTGVTTSTANPSSLSHHAAASSPHSRQSLTTQSHASAGSYTGKNRLLAVAEAAVSHVTFDQASGANASHAGGAHASLGGGSQGGRPSVSIFDLLTLKKKSLNVKSNAAGGGGGGGGGGGANVPIASSSGAIVVVGSSTSASAHYPAQLSHDSVQSSAYTCLAFSADNKCLLTQAGAPCYTLINWAWEKGKALQIARVSNTQAAPIHQVSFCPTDSSVVCVSGQGVLRFLHCEATEFKSIPFSMGKREPGNYVCHAWSEERVLVCSDSGDILLFENAEYRGVLEQSPSDGKAITSIAVYSKGFAVGCDDGLIYMYEREEMHAQQQAAMARGSAGSAGMLNSSSTGPGGNNALTTTTTSNQQGKELYKLSKHFFIDQNFVKILQLVLSPSEDALIAQLENSQLYTLQLSNTELLKQDEIHFDYLVAPFHNAAIHSMALCIRKPLLVTCGADRSVRIWNYATRQCEMMKFFTEVPFCVSFHPSGLYVLVGFADSLRLFHLLQDEIRLYKEFSIKQVRYASFSHGGQYFAIVNGNSNILQIYNTYTCQLMTSFNNIQQSITQLGQQSTNGSGSVPGTASSPKHQLNVSTGGGTKGPSQSQTSAALINHSSKIKSLYWTFDDMSLLSGTNDGSLFLTQIKDGSSLCLYNEQLHGTSSLGLSGGMSGGSGSAAIMNSLHTTSALYGSGGANASNNAANAGMNAIRSVTMNSVLCGYDSNRVFASASDGTIKCITYDATQSNSNPTSTQTTTLLLQPAALQQQQNKNYASSASAAAAASTTSMHATSLVLGNTSRSGVKDRYLIVGLANGGIRVYGLPIESNSTAVATATASTSSSNANDSSSGGASGTTGGTSSSSSHNYNPQQASHNAPMMASNRILFDLHVHQSAVTQLALSADDALLFSISDDGCLAIFQLNYNGQQLSGLTEMSSAKGASQGVATTSTRSTRSDHLLPWSEEILITRADLEQRLSLLTDLSSKVAELQRNNTTALYERELIYSEKLHELQSAYENEVDIHEKMLSLLQQHRTDLERSSASKQDYLTQLQADKHAQLTLHHSNKCEHEAQRLAELQRHVEMQQQQHARELESALAQQQSALALMSQQHAQAMSEQHAAKSQLALARTRLVAEFGAMKSLLENEAASESLAIQQQYDALLHGEHVTTLKLKDQNAILKRKFTALRQDIGANLDCLSQLSTRQNAYYTQIDALEKDIATHGREIVERESTIGDKLYRIFELRAKNRQLEKFRFVLDYKIAELKRQIAPRRSELERMRHANAEMKSEASDEQRKSVWLKLDKNREILKIHSIDTEEQEMADAVSRVAGILQRMKAEMAEGCHESTLYDRDRLKSKIKELHRRYVQSLAKGLSMDALPPPSVLPSGTNATGSQSGQGSAARIQQHKLGNSVDSLHRDYQRQRHYLEHNIDSLHVKLDKSVTIHRKEHKKIVAENVELVGEINELRREIVLMKQFQHKQATGGGAGQKSSGAAQQQSVSQAVTKHSKQLNAPTTAGEQQRRALEDEIEMQQEQIRALRNARAALQDEWQESQQDEKQKQAADESKQQQQQLRNEASRTRLPALT